MEEVRLIDANALDLSKLYIYFGDVVCIEDVQKMVDQAPTIDVEPVIHARWEWYEEPITSLYPDPDYGWRCSHCKEDVARIIQRASPTSDVEFDNMDVPPNFDHCPYCGAKMDLEVHDETHP